MAPPQKSEGAWGRRAPLYLMRDLNCAHASLEISQDMMGRREDRLLKAITGLEGGVVASGSTCGVVTGGALGLALRHEKAIEKGGEAVERGVLKKVGDYVQWFESRFGASRCRQRSGIDFYTPYGQLRYLVPGDRLGKCLWHIRGAARHLHNRQTDGLPETPAPAAEPDTEPIHCAQAVLQGIRERTGVGDELLERLAFVFDGGVGLQGGACGALTGAIMGLNCLLGIDIRHTGYFQTMKAFAVGHANLLLEKPIGGKPEPFTMGKKIVNQFRQDAGAIDCRDITQKTFAGWDDFQSYMAGSETCASLIDRTVTHASDLITVLQGADYARP